MGKKAKSFGRADLVKLLEESEGLSRRKATLVVNAILEAMIARLKRGRKVKLPYGRLEVVRRYFNAYWKRIDDWPADQPGYTVGWVLDLKDEMELYPELFPKRKARRRRAGR